MVAVPVRRTNAAAVTSLVLGLVGLPLFVLVLPGLAALLSGALAQRQLTRTGDREDGRGQAVAGVVLGFLGLAFGVWFWVHRATTGI
jgi:hypothetical protein